MEDIKLNKFISDFSGAVTALVISLDEQYDQSLEVDGWEYKQVRPVNYLPQNAKELFNTFVKQIFNQPSEIIQEARLNLRNRGKEIAECYVNDLLNQAKKHVDTLNRNFVSVDNQFLKCIELAKEDAHGHFFDWQPLSDESFSLLQQAIKLNTVYFNLPIQIKEQLPGIKPYTEPVHELDQFDIKEKTFPLAQRLVLLDELGIIDHLRKKYSFKDGQDHGKLAALLALVLQTDPGERRNLVATTKNLVNKAEKTPRNPTSINAVQSELKRIGLI